MTRIREEEWASNTGVRKNRDFRLISRFISEMIQYRAIVTMEGQYRNSYMIYQIVPLNDLNPDLRSCHYLTLNISETVRDRDMLI